MYITDVITKAIKKKQKFAREYFRTKYPKPNEEAKEILNEIKEQIQICEELCCPVSESIIKDWIDNGNLAYINNSARRIKFA